MRVDRHIVAAIDRYQRDNKMTAKEMCEKLGISEPAFVKWRRPGKGILDRNWDILFPMIKPFLPKERFYIDQLGNEQYSSMLEGAGGNPYFIPRYIPQMVPEFTSEELKAFPYIVQSVEQYAINLNAPRIEYRPRTQGAGAGVFALTVDFENGIIPVNSLVFASTELRPKDGSIVFFSDSNGELNLGRFQVSGQKYSVATSGRYIEGSVTEIREKISWIFPVLYYEVVTF